ncbi:MAG: FG-GAP-like repeat-containing protein [Bryobacterales bacterium]|nr:FG-GAP-like repeat-containing protein [Bryobacteraceae bacterium]MDW8354086.1 FG-GAP-like repeat-containing protein [Bryobacterales bacterium]
MKLRVPIAVLAVAGTAFLFLRGADTAAVREEQLARHRNLGKAYYESPTTQMEAVEELRKALELAPDSARDRLNYGLALLRAGKTKEGVAELEKVQKQDPNLPHTWFNLGIVFKKEGDYARAAEQFERMVQLVPDEAISHYNLGVLYRLLNRPDEALRAFEKARDLDPNLAAARFQLYNAYRRIGREQEAARELQIFQEIKKRQEGSPTPEDVDWSFYAELYDVVDPKASADDTPAAELRFQVQKLTGAADPRTAGATVVDVNGDDRPDLLVWSEKGVAIYTGGFTLLARSGLEGLASVISVAPADFNNDGLVDVLVLLPTGPSLYFNRKGRFQKADVPGLAFGRFEKAVWLDYDHDYDLDLFLFGDRSVLLRNQGEAGLADRTSEFPFAPGRALDAVAFRSIADGKGMDLLVSYADRPGVLYRDRLAGKFEQVAVDGLPAQARHLLAADADNDGWMDAVAATSSGIVWLWNRQGQFQAAAGPRFDGAFTLADFENRGLADLLSGSSVYRNQGARRFVPGKTPQGLPAAAAWTAADFDLDGRIDVAAAGTDGAIYRLLNRTALTTQWLRVKLKGVKNLLLAPGAEVEVKSGLLYQKKIYTGAPLLFGLRTNKEVDTVRITWPNGLIQNEPKQVAGRALAFEEAQRLSGSCPMIFTWNGREFQFIGDALGVAPLGARAGDDAYFPVDHDEYVQIPAGGLVPKDDYYEVRVTEELREVTYLDQIRLLAVDHPANVEVFTNEKFKAPPFPEFRLFGVRGRIYPVRARDGKGNDMLDELRRADRVYAASFRRDFTGVAETHSLELDFGPDAARDNRAILVLRGWVDWADGSTFFRLAQQGHGALFLPYLQVKDARGRWQTVVADMGIPAGQLKTIVVDLTGKFLSSSREVRIVTNLCLYWDEIFLAEDSSAPPVRLTELGPHEAELRFRGFSRAIIHPQRAQPEAFDYARVSPVSMWNPTPGLYTRYGDVRELLEAEDDRYVIMGSGDEIRLRFRAASLPPVPSGWRRNFLLKLDGWNKDGDFNTAYSQSVEPLPFHGMSRYPYPPSERFPDTEAHRRWREQYLTRPARLLIPPLSRALRTAGMP